MSSTVVPSDSASQSDNAFQAVAPQNVRADASLVSNAALGNMVEGLEFPFQYIVKSIKNTGQALVHHTPSTQDKVATRAMLFQQAEFVELEAVAIPLGGLLNNAATITLAWVPSGTAPSTQSNAASFPGAVIRTYGGPTFIGQDAVAVAPLHGGLQGLFRSNVTLNYQPILFYHVTKAWDTSASSPEALVFQIMVRGKLRLSGQMLVSWE